MSTKIGVPPNVSEWMIQAVTRLLATWAIVVGARILLGGDARFASPSLSVALQFPGAPPSWGWWAVLAGAALLTGSLAGWRHLVLAGALACLGWCGTFGLTLYLAEVQLPNASSTGVPTYLTFAVLFVLVLAAYVRPRSVR